MKTKIGIFAAILCGFTLSGNTQRSAKELLVDNAQIVVEAEVIDYSLGRISEMVLIKTAHKIKVLKVLKGKEKLSLGDEIWVGVATLKTLYEIPTLGGRYLYFIEEKIQGDTRVRGINGSEMEKVNYSTTDTWFGCLESKDFMVFSIEHFLEQRKE